MFYSFYRYPLPNNIEGRWGEEEADKRIYSRGTERDSGTLLGTFHITFHGILTATL